MIQGQLADLIGEQGPRLLELPARDGRGPGPHAGDMRLQVALGRADADLLQSLGGQGRAHRLGPAHQADQFVVGGVVALLHRPLQQLADGGAVAAPAQPPGDRFVEDAAVVGTHHHFLVEPQPAALDAIDRGQRHPRLGDALLGQHAVAVDFGDPSPGHVGHRQAHRLVVVRGQGLQALLKGCGRRRSGRPPGRGHGGLPGRRLDHLAGRGRQAHHRGLHGLADHEPGRRQRQQGQRHDQRQWPAPHRRAKSSKQPIHGPSKAATPASFKPVRPAARPRTDAWPRRRAAISGVQTLAKPSNTAPLTASPD